MTQMHVHYLSTAASIQSAYFNLIIYFVFDTLDDLTESMSSLLEINQFLRYVKDKFSEVLLPVEVVTKLDFIGKGIFPLIKVRPCMVNYYSSFLLQEPLA